ARGGGGGGGGRGAGWGGGWGGAGGGRGPGAGGWARGRGAEGGGGGAPTAGRGGPPAALDLGILPAFEWLVAEFEKRTAIRCSLSVPGAGAELAQDRGIVLFRILQESLTNIARHAGARNVEIMVDMEPDGIRLAVRDDGRGFG